MKGFVVVHLGAGNYAKSHHPAYCSLAEEACTAAIEALQSGCDAVEAATRAVEVLENSPLTNAGVGSNLTTEGHVECDASVMCSRASLFGAVGAVKCLKNPVRTAEKLLRLQSKGSMTCGRIPPSFLAGPGAEKWASDNGCVLINPRDLITKGALRQFASNTNKLKLAEFGVQDTVGAICVDSNGNVASAASSGGIAMKHSGRIGPAACYGAGTWCESEGPSAVAVCATGSGEYMMRTLIAERACSALKQRDMLQDIVEKYYNKSSTLSLIPETEKLIGLLAVESSGQGSKVVMTYCHSTKNMCIGFSTTSAMKRPVSFVSELPLDKEPGKSLMSSGHAFTLSKKSASKC